MGPDLNDAPAGDTAYLDGIQHGVLRYQRCAACGRALTLSRLACPRCGSAELPWLASKGSGHVYALTHVTRAPSDAFRSLVPYTLVLVDLDEGPRLMAHGVPGLRIGERVRALPLRAGSLCLMQFHPEPTVPPEGPP